MTKEQAIEILRCNTDLGNGVIIENESTQSIYEALEMAIKALEQQPIAEERYQDLIEYFGDENVAKCVLEDREEFKKWLERIKWHVRKADELARKLEQQPCEDCVSRQAVLDKAELVELEDGQTFYSIDPEDVKALSPVTPTHGTCKDCKYNVKGKNVPTMCDRGHRFFMREPSTFYCADFEKRGNEND